jgi:hypothetical protein
MISTEESVTPSKRGTIVPFGTIPSLMSGKVKNPRSSSFYKSSTPVARSTFNEETVHNQLAQHELSFGNINYQSALRRRDPALMPGRRKLYLHETADRPEQQLFLQGALAALQATDIKKDLARGVVGQNKKGQFEFIAEPQYLISEANQEAVTESTSFINYRLHKDLIARTLAKAATEVDTIRFQGIRDDATSRKKIIEDTLKRAAVARTRIEDQPPGGAGGAAPLVPLRGREASRAAAAAEAVAATAAEAEFNADQATRAQALADNGQPAENPATIEARRVQAATDSAASRRAAAALPPPVASPENEAAAAALVEEQLRRAAEDERDAVIELRAPHLGQAHGDRARHQ